MRSSQRRHGRIPRGRHEDWIDRRSPWAAELIRQAKLKKGRRLAVDRISAFNDNMAGMDKAKDPS